MDLQLSKQCPDFIRNISLELQGIWGNFQTRRLNHHWFLCTVSSTRHRWDGRCVHVRVAGGGAVVCVVVIICSLVALKPTVRTQLTVNYQLFVILFASFVSVLQFFHQLLPYRHSIIIFLQTCCIRFDGFDEEMAYYAAIGCNNDRNTGDLQGFRWGHWFVLQLLIIRRLRQMLPRLQLT